MPNTQGHRLNSKYVMTRVGGEAVVAPICDSTADMGQIMSINATGAKILDCLKQGMTDSQTADYMVKQYPDAKPEIVRTGVSRFIDEMLDKGILEPEDDSM